MADYAARLRQQRKLAGLSQRELGVQAGVNPATVMRIEARTTKVPSWRVLRKLAARLGCLPTDLIPND